MITKIYEFGRGPAEGRLDNVLYHNVAMTIEDLTVTWPNYVIGVAGSLGWQGVLGTGGDSVNPQAMLLDKPAKYASVLFREVNYYGNFMAVFDKDNVEIGRVTLDLDWFNSHGDFRAFIAFPENVIRKVVTSGENAGDWITWSDVTFQRDIPDPIPFLGLDAPKFEYEDDDNQSIELELTVPATPYTRSVGPAVGGDIDGDSGMRAAYVVYRSEFLTFNIRAWETQIPDVMAWIDMVMDGRQFIFQPIATEDNPFFVTLESPAAGSAYAFQPDSELPELMTLTILLKAVSTFDGLVPLPLPDEIFEPGEDSEPPEPAGSRDMPAVSGAYLLDWSADLLTELDGDPVTLPSPSERGSPMNVFNSGATDGVPIVSRLGGNNIKAIKQRNLVSAIEFTSGSPHSDFIDDFTYYLVCKIDFIHPEIGASGQFYNGAGLLLGEQSGATTDYGMSVFSGGGIVVGSGPGDTTSAPGGQILDGEPHVLAFRRRKSDGLMQGSIDGVIVTQLNNSAGVTLSNNNPDTPYFYQLQGDYARVLGYTAFHSDAEVTLITNALRAFYGF